MIVFSTIIKIALSFYDLISCHFMKLMVEEPMFSFSRAHTVVGVTLTQKRKNEAGEETAKVSLINLVDLAGR